MGQVIFVVCRESIEALLVIGILWAWLNRSEETRAAKNWLIGGIFGGLGLAVLLALALIGVTTFLPPVYQSWFEICMLTFAAALIIQMVLWMRAHGRTLKRELETGLQEKVEQKNWWGIFFLSMIAVGREGSETVIFLYGSFVLAISQGTFSAYFFFFLAALIGFALALLFFYLLQISSRFISWRVFFKVTEILLLFLGSALFLTATEKLGSDILSNYNWCPLWLFDQVWNTSGILNDGSTFGNLMSTLFAYRSQPNYLNLIAYAIYWGCVFLLFAYTNKKARIKDEQLRAEAARIKKEQENAISNNG